MAGDTDSVLARAADLTAAGDAESAIRLLRQVLTADSSNSEAWCRLATAQLAGGDATRALASARRALQLHSEQGWPYRLISLALNELGRHAEAVSAARESVHVEPENWRTYVTLANVLAEYRSPDVALDPARTATNLAPEHSRPHEVLGELAERAGERDVAQRAYAAALRLDPRSSAATEGLQRLRDQPEPPAARSPEPATRAAPAPQRVGGVVRRSPRASSGRVSTVVATQRAFSALVLRTSVCLGGGSLVLLLAGLPSPTRALAWVAAVLLLACVGIAAFGMRELPETSRWPPRMWWRGAPSMGLAGALVCVATLLVFTWTAVLAAGTDPPRLLPFALACTLVSGMLGVLGSPHRTRLWRKFFK